MINLVHLKTIFTVIGFTILTGTALANPIHDGQSKIFDPRGSVPVGPLHDPRNRPVVYNCEKVTGWGYDSVSTYLYRHPDRRKVLKNCKLSPALDRSSDTVILLTRSLMTEAEFIKTFGQKALKAAVRSRNLPLPGSDTHSLPQPSLGNFRRNSGFAVNRVDKLDVDADENVITPVVENTFYASKCAIQEVQVYIDGELVVEQKGGKIGSISISKSDYQIYKVVMRAKKSSKFDMNAIAQNQLYAEVSKSEDGMSGIIKAHMNLDAETKTLVFEITGTIYDQGRVFQQATEIIKAVCK